MWHADRGHEMKWQIAIVALIAVILLGALLSFRWAFGYQAPNRRYEWFVVQGNLYINTVAAGYVATQPGWPWRPGFAVHRARLFLPWVSPPSIEKLGPSRWHAVLPLYVPIVLLCAVALYPRIPFIRRRWRAKRGLCPNCGYDVTGNVSGRCPECGEPVRKGRDMFNSAGSVDEK